MILYLVIIQVFVVSLSLLTVAVIMGFEYISTKHTDRIRAIFEEDIKKYLYTQDKLPQFKFVGIGNRYYKRILIRLINSLSGRFGCVENKILLYIFRNNALHIDLQERCNHRNVENRCRALSVFSNIVPQRLTMFTLAHHMYSIHHQERMFAINAYIAIHPEKIMMTLKNYTYPLTKRDYANFYNLILKRDIDISNVGILLKSDNGSVVEFGLRLIELFALHGFNEEIATAKYNIKIKLWTGVTHYQ